MRIVKLLLAVTMSSGCGYQQADFLFECRHYRRHRIPPIARSWSVVWATAVSNTWGGSSTVRVGARPIPQTCLTL